MIKKLKKIAMWLAIIAMAVAFAPYVARALALFGDLLVDLRAWFLATLFH